MKETFALGLDIGGTFTDFVLLSDQTNRRVLFKHLTTYPDASHGVMEGLHLLLEQEQITASAIHTIVHSTTLVTNAIIERKGARAGLLTTAGFRHILDLGKEQRYDTYDLHLKYPEPLIAQRHRREITERMDRDGHVLIPLQPAEAEAAVTELVNEGVTSIAVSLLHAYRNPVHEAEIAALIRRLYPEIAVSLSSEVAPLIGEWERTATVAADAYVRPIVSQYLTRLEQELTALGFAGHFYMMLSGGGTATVETARRYPIRLLESGPASGVLAARYYGELTGRPDLLAFDMGGTTAKACLIEDGQPKVGEEMEAGRVHRFKQGSGLPIRVPSLELIEIGAGGGSIAWIDPLGLMRVGPQSASSTPGPVCYGRGGTEPTVTDANLLLGYFDPHFFNGGRISLHLDEARGAIARLGERLGLDPVETAWGIHHTVNENMAAAARMHIIERGRDPRRYAFVASGGAGPAHATGVARILGAPEVILAVGAGTLSAFGCLVAPLSFHLSRTYVAELDDADWNLISQLTEEMAAEGRRLLTGAGAQEDTISLEITAHMRMVGQIHTVTIQMPPGPLTAASEPVIRERFHETYTRLFTRTDRNRKLEFVNWHVSAQAWQRRVQLSADSGASLSADTAIKGRRQAYFPATGYAETPVYDRYRMRTGMQITGPAIVEERESTAILHPGDVATVDPYLNLVIGVNA